MAMSKKNFETLLEGIKEGKAYRKMGIDGLPKARVHVPDIVNVVDIRKNLGMSQSVFAQTFGFSVKSVQEWEQGRRRPEKAARVLLKIIAANPDYVVQTLKVA